MQIEPQEEGRTNGRMNVQGNMAGNQITLQSVDLEQLPGLPIHTSHSLIRRSGTRVVLQIGQI